MSIDQPIHLFSCSAKPYDIPLQWHIFEAFDCAAQNVSQMRSVKHQFVFLFSDVI